ncbi:hypothetical protein NG799_10080 [Laspinema sp. D1]|uniref:Uncharacterized protein n=1 Tax=Laspinema palackyanum D2a TaxID=2953684 RepID=A0ABT2MPP8_9CYAN|nr:hypothetical protein [Laspinema sp. D2a]
MVIHLTSKYTSGPLPLARGGLGWGPSSPIPYGIAPLTATSRTLGGDHTFMESGETSFLVTCDRYGRRTPP